MAINVVDLYKLIEFSQKKGVLNTLEDRQRVKKNVLKTRNFNVVLICLETDQEIPSRPEPYDVCFYIIDGKGMFTVGNEQAELSRGNVIFAPASVARGIKSKERLILLGIQEAH
jgi:quercetin dioxygenase-like cupin family protein